MYFEWKVCNSSELSSAKFPEINKNIILDNYYNQQYRIWETSESISLYQSGKRTIVLYKVDHGIQYLFGTNDFYRLQLLEDGTYDVYHGQVG